jgi:hypothetical protein
VLGVICDPPLLLRLPRLVDTDERRYGEHRDDETSESHRRATPATTPVALPPLERLAGVDEVLLMVIERA